jgi:hypothetical protein
MGSMQEGIKQDKKKQKGNELYDKNREYIDGKLSQANLEIKKEAYKMRLRSTQSLQLQEEYIKSLDGESMGHMFSKKNADNIKAEAI